MCLLPLARPLLQDPRTLLDPLDLPGLVAPEDREDLVVPEVLAGREVLADQEVTLWRS